MNREEIQAEQRAAKMQKAFQQRLQITLELAFADATKHGLSFICVDDQLQMRNVPVAELIKNINEIKKVSLDESDDGSSPCISQKKSESKNASHSKIICP